MPIEVQALDAGHCLHRMPAHGHTFFELVLITGGHGRHGVGGQAFEAVPGTLFLVAPGVIHDGRCLGSASGWVVLFLDEAAGSGLAGAAGGATGLLLDAFRASAEPSSDAMRLDGAEQRDAAASIERIADELGARRLGYEVAVRNLLQLVLVRLARHARPAGTAPSGSDAMRHGALATRVFADIDAHFGQEASLREAGRRLGLGAGYLTTLLRRETGRTYGQWVIERRMMEARRLLGATDRPVGDIAGDVGYAEVTSFVRRFRERHGVSPTHWRDAQQAPPARGP